MGASLGLILGYVGVRLAFRLPVGDARNYFCLGLAYVVYLAGALIGGSAVVTAAVTALMVVGTLLLWPQEAFLEPRPLALALLGALVAIFFLRFMLDPVFDLFEIKRRPPDASRVKTKEAPSE